MKRSYLGDIENSDLLLSIFNLPGFLIQNDSSYQSKGLEGDLEKLLQDQYIIEQDYRLAVERIYKELQETHE